MRTIKRAIFLLTAIAFLSFFTSGTGTTFADTPVTLEQPVHFTTAEGSDVVLEAGDYGVEPTEEWIRIIPSGGNPVDTLLLEAQAGTHEESLKAPLALSATGEQPDTHHLALLLPDGKRLEAIGSYSGIRSRGRLSLLTIQRLKRLSSSSQRTTPTEFKTPLFGGSGGNRSYNLDCGNRSVLVGAIYKAGSWLDAIGIICQRVNPKTGALEDEFTKGPVGGSGGRARNRRCNDGKVAQGARALSGQFINALMIFCSQWDPARKSPVFSRNSDCARADGRRCIFVGSQGGSLEGSFFCPRGKVGKAIRGRHGIYIDNLKFICDNWDK